MIGTKNTQIAGNTISPYITYGVGEYKINSFEIKTASTGAMKVMMNMESKPFNDPSFTPAEEATVGGKIGTVSLTSYMNPNNASFTTGIDIFQQKVKQIATALDVSDEVDAVEAPSLEEYVKLISPTLTNKYAFFCISAEEYMGSDREGNPKVKFTLNIPRYQFVSASDTLTFDKSKTYHYKKLTTNPQESFVSSDNDAQW